MVQLKRYGGFAIRDMNGKQEFQAESMALGVQYVIKKEEKRILKFRILFLFVLRV